MPPLCFTDAVWRLLEPLRAEDREAFLALAHRRTFARNEVLCHEGDPAD
jgi:CRP-like cAMP-binding protein